MARCHIPEARRHSQLVPRGVCWCIGDPGGTYLFVELRQRLLGALLCGHGDGGWRWDAVLQRLEIRQRVLLGVVVQSVLALFCGGEDYGGAIVGCGKRVLTYRASDDAAWSPFTSQTGRSCSRHRAAQRQAAHSQLRSFEAAALSHRGARDPCTVGICF
jgi:hypothetical protein